MKATAHDIFNTPKLVSRLSQLGLRSLLGSTAIARLTTVSFLGALGPGDDEIDSRYQHSLGVAYIASTIADSCVLTPRTRRYLVTTGLLHDLGHWPLAHTCEAAFEQLTSRSGRALRAAMVLGEPNLPADYRLRSRLMRLGLHAEVVAALLEKREPARPRPVLEWQQILDILSCPINPDTLDGIYRAAYLSHLPCPDPLEIILGFFRDGDRLYVKRDHLHRLDEFWLAKARIYAAFINPREAKLWESRYAKTALAKFELLEARQALGLKETEIRGELEMALKDAEEQDIRNLAFRRPREYYIDETDGWQDSAIPLPQLQRRYKSEPRA